MKFVFLLGIVALCVMYMHAPVSHAKGPLFRSLQKRSGDGDQSEEAEAVNEELTGELMAGIDNTIDDTRKKQSGDDSQKQKQSEGNRIDPKESEKKSEEANIENGERMAGIDNVVDERRKRAATDKKKIKEWPSIKICYKFKDEATANTKKTFKNDQNQVTKTVQELMKEAADTWNKATGLEIHHDENGQDCMVVGTDQAGCWSWIGKQPPGKDEINLQAPGCLDPGVILHEIGHALGLIHEVKRDDRDDNVDVKFDNVKTDAKEEFTKDDNAVGIDCSAYFNMGAYDYCSIMHYSATAFSSNNQPTIVMKGDSNRAEDITPCMGSQNGLSLRDGEGVAQLYKTLETDGAAITRCKHKGYLLKNKADCVCSNLFTGPTCETPKSDAKCGDTTINLTPTNKEVEFCTPNFGKGSYPTSTSCTWVFNSPPGTQVVLKFPNGYDLEVAAKGGSCAFDWFEVIIDELLTLKTKRYCGNPESNKPMLNIPAETNVAVLVFSSDSMYTAKGFCATVTYEGTATETNVQATKENPKKLKKPKDKKKPQKQVNFDNMQYVDPDNTDNTQNAFPQYTYVN